jgi:RNA polymerase sigma factor (sigma-70 family)
MEQLRKLRLLDEDGKALSTRVDGVLAGLLQKFRKRFPSIQDEVDLTEVFEEAARRIDKRERRSGPIEKVHSYAWVTLRSIGLSWLRRGSSQLERRTIQSEAGQSILTTLAAREGSPQQIEQDILLRELRSQLTADERVVLILKKAGYSSDEIARQRGSSAGAVDVLFTRVKGKIRRFAGVQE